MNYNFETISKRYHTGARKWDEMLSYAVREDEDIIPFSVADMEFETAPEIVAALKDELDHYVLGYANPTAEYLNTVCRWMRQRHISLAIRAAVLNAGIWPVRPAMYERPWNG